jgi:hypothetical protein
MDKVMMDLISNGQGNGQVAKFLQANGKIEPNALRPYVDEKTGKAYITVFSNGDPKKPENYKAIQVNSGTLRRDEWKTLDEALLEVARERLSGFDYLIGKGLVYNLGNALATTVLEWHTISDSQEAILSMDAVARSQGDRVNFKYHYLPIPILHADYEINARALAVSRNMGNGLDVTEAQNAARRILEKQEDMLFTNTSYSWGDKGADNRNTIYSLINFPDRNPVTLTEAWDATGKTAAEILADVVALKNANIEAKFFGPYTLFIPTLWDAILDEDYSVAGASLMSIRERILKVNGIQAIVTVDRLPANNAILLQTTPNVVRIINGMGLQNVEWSTEGGMVNKYKVMTIRVPQIRSDYNGKTGIAHLA